MNAEQTFAPKSLSASEYVLALFEPADEVAILTRNRRTGRTVQRIATAETIAGPQFQSWLRSENAAGADIFIGMNPIKNGANGRTKENIREIRHLYLDLDTGGQNALDAIRNSPEVPAPNFVLDTSPDKHQVVWRVKGLEPRKLSPCCERWPVNSAAIRQQPTRPAFLRLPGFANRKYEEEFIVQAHHESNAVYHARDFQLQEDSPETPRRFETETGADNLAAGTGASPSRIGPTPNAPLRAAMIPQSSSSASPISEPTTSPIPSITPATPSRRRKPSCRAVQQCTVLKQPKSAITQGKYHEPHHNRCTGTYHLDATEDEFPMTVREAAKFLGVSQQTVYLWVERKQIPHLRVMGRNIRFLKSELASFRASFKQEMEND